MKGVNVKQVKKNENLYVEMKNILKNGVIGFYNCIEVVEVFMFKNGAIFNVFTILILSKKNEIPNESKLINNERIKLQGRSESYGIKISYLPIEKCEEAFKNLLEEKKWIMDKDEKFKISDELECVGKYFAPSDSSDVVPINQILKNNFFNGSYVFEITDKTKDHLSFFYEEKTLLQELTVELKKYIPISLASVSDKLGNYVFQFPVDILSYKLTYNENKNLICKISWHDDAEKRDLIVTARGVEKDNLLEDFSVAKINSESNCCELNFKVDKSFLAYIIDIETSIIYAAVRESRFMMSDHFKVEVIKEIDCKKRNFKINEENFEVWIEDNKNEIQIMNWIDKRIYTNDIEVAKNKKYFVQYSKDHHKLEEELHREALKDIHWLLDNYGQEEVWLWDPYLDYEDMAKTLFYNKYSNSKMKAITASKNKPDKKVCKLCESEMLTRCKNECVNKDDYKIFKSLDENFLNTINLEFRTTKGTSANTFHDRFIIFPKTFEGAMAWSLGISINQYGKTHHILQKVTDGQMTADAFQTFWNQIKGDNQLIWKSKND